MRLAFALLAVTMPASLVAQNAVTLTSVVKVEKTVEVSGQRKIVLEDPKVVTPGDRLRFMLTYRNGGSQPATNFVATNPMPAAVAFAGEASPGAVVSIDGGKAYASLAALKVRNPDGSFRPAAPADVTHIRWTIARPIPAGGTGQLSFRGVIR